MTTEHCEADTGTSPFAMMDHFSNLDDPRREHGQRHLLEDLLMLTICAVIGGADTCVAVEEFGLAKRAWLQRYLRLPNGIPSHDTLGSVFARLDPRQFEQGFLAWVNAVFARTAGAVVAIDGKTRRRRYDQRSKKAALQMVSAWATQNYLVLGQVAVEATANERTAIPKLLELLDVSGCIVTIDAVGCQQGLAQQIIASDADYVLALKGNQGSLLHEAQQALATGKATEISVYETQEQAHGRKEVRPYRMCAVPEGSLRPIQWAGRQSFGMVEATRTLGDKTPVERRYYISSLPPDAVRLTEAVRGHWGIENQLHWVLDVALNEDDSRMRTGHAAANMAVVRRIALNLLKHETRVKLGVANKRLKAAWDEEYLLKILLPE